MVENLIHAQITGIGWVNAAGSGRGPSKPAADWPTGSPTIPAAALKSFKGGSRFGRLDLLARIGVAAIGLALQDAGLLPEPQQEQAAGRPRQSTGIICATTSSSSVTDQKFFRTVNEEPQLASPGLFVYTLATSFLGEAALRFSLTGLTMAVIEARPGGKDAVCTAMEELHYGDDAVMLAGICNLFAEKSPAQELSGALFLVLEKTQNNDSALPAGRYATLSCNPQKNDLYCNHKPCPDIFSIVKRVRG